MFHVHVGHTSASQQQQLVHQPPMQSQMLQPLQPMQTQPMQMQSPMQQMIQPMQHMQQQSMMQQPVQQRVVPIAQPMNFLPSPTGLVPVPAQPISVAQGWPVDGLQVFNTGEKRKFDQHRVRELMLGGTYEKTWPDREVEIVGDLFCEADSPDPEVERTAVV